MLSNSVLAITSKNFRLGLRLQESFSSNCNWKWYIVFFKIYCDLESFILIFLLIDRVSSCITFLGPYYLGLQCPLWAPVWVYKDVSYKRYFVNTYCYAISQSYKLVAEFYQHDILVFLKTLPKYISTVEWDQFKPKVKKQSHD